MKALSLSFIVLLYTAQFNGCNKPDAKKIPSEKLVSGYTISVPLIRNEKPSGEKLLVVKVENDTNDQVTSAETIIDMLVSYSCNESWFIVEDFNRGKYGSIVFTLNEQESQFLETILLSELILHYKR